MQLSTEERKDMVEQKRNEIINYFHKYYLDPKTKKPHPVTRIESALSQIKVRIDPDIPVDKQVLEISKKLIEVIPIKRSEMEATIAVPHQWIGQVQGIIKKYCTITSDKYTDVGCEYGVAFVPGDYDIINNELKSATKDNYSFDVVGVGIDQPQEEQPTKGRKGGPKKGGGRGRKNK